MMSGTLILAEGTEWSASSGLFNWVVEYLANHVRDEHTRAALRQVYEHDFRWLDVSDLRPDGQAEVLALLRDAVVQHTEENLPDTPVRAEAVALVRQLAGMAGAPPA